MQLAEHAASPAPQIPPIWQLKAVSLRLFSTGVATALVEAARAAMKKATDNFIVDMMRLFVVLDAQLLQNLC
jgi:hypothetical protein